MRACGMFQARYVLAACLVTINVAFGNHLNPNTPNTGCRSLMDLFIVIDGSDSISSSDFTTLRKAISSLVPQLELGPTKARMGMLVYSAEIASFVSFSSDKDYLTDKASRLVHPRDGTKTSWGLGRMIHEFGTNGREDVPGICITITDGISKNFKNTSMQAQIAKEMGISMFAVGITDKINMTELEAIASSKEQVILLENFNQLQGMLRSMMLVICPCSSPPPMENAEIELGSNAIGSVRRYQCKPGYAIRGSAETRCQNDLTWSKSNFECITCPEPPTINNGKCGGGPYTINSKRTYICDHGYELFGNGDIYCQADATWSDVYAKCEYACGETPLISNGQCGGGDHMFGSIRKLSCDAGYLASGTAEIFCQQDRTWSTTDFACNGCGDPPVVPNGVCQSGHDRIGAKRKYTCNTGYTGEGNADIECLDNGIWSGTDFTCKIDCGQAPFLANAYSNFGPSTYGSRREYFCEAGYQLEGGVGRTNPRGIIKCESNGEWTQPTFSCRVKTTTTTVAPTPDPLDPSICDMCKVSNGAGYNNHPFDCNQYIQCSESRPGIYNIPVYRQCPFNMFWDQEILTCRQAAKVHCPHDPCRLGNLRGYKHREGAECCAYWECMGGKSYGKCCGMGKVYNKTANKCEENLKCESPCPGEIELPAEGCDKAPAATKDKYLQFIGGHKPIEMPCAPGTHFNPVECDCSLFAPKQPSIQNVNLQGCQPALALRFNDGVMSSNGVHIENENVTVRNGAAVFNGNSRLQINRFSNTEFWGDLVIKFRYKEDKFTPNAIDLQALVTNGDCGEDPSIIIAKVPDFILMAAKTNRAHSMFLPTEPHKEWKEVMFIHNGKRLEGKVCGASKSTYSWGPIRNTHCALNIGFGQGLSNFVGEIDDFYIYQCRPSVDELNFSY